MVGDRYQVVKQLGKGGHGSVYQVQQNGSDFPLALKAGRAGKRSLEMEQEVLEELRPLGLAPTPHNFLNIGDHKILVMDMKGPSLKMVADEAGGKLNVSQVSRLMVQMMEHLRLLHETGYIHRDVKPHNWVLESPDHHHHHDKEKNQSHKLYLIDFGLSAKYVYKNGTHMPRKTNIKPRGTSVYMSIKSHKHVRQSRRDDMESLAYTALKLLSGGLPWHRLKDKTHPKFAETKKRLSPKKMFRGFPKEFSQFLRYSRGLGYDEQPDYTKWLEKFGALANATPVDPG